MNAVTRVVQPVDSARPIKGLPSCIRHRNLPLNGPMQPYVILFTVRHLNRNYPYQAAWTHIAPSSQSPRSIAHAVTIQSSKTISWRGELVEPGIGGGSHHVCTPFKLLRAAPRPWLHSSPLMTSSCSVRVEPGDTLQHLPEYLPGPPMQAETPTSWSHQTSTHLDGCTLRSDQCFTDQAKSAISRSCRGCRPVPRLTWLAAIL